MSESPPRLEVAFGDLPAKGRGGSGAGLGGRSETRAGRSTVECGQFHVQRGLIDDVGMDDSTVLKEVRSLIFTQREKVYWIAQTSGGWEGWLQCELAWRFRLSALREAHVWKNRLKVDFHFGSSNYVVELKALGWNVIQGEKGTFRSKDSELNAFVNRVLADKLKIMRHRGAGISIAIVPAFNELYTNKILDDLKKHSYTISSINRDISMAFWSQGEPRVQKRLLSGGESRPKKRARA